MCYIRAKTPALFTRFCNEFRVCIGVAPERPTWMGHIDEKGIFHEVCSVLGEDGTVWTAHNLSEEQRAEVDAYDPGNVWTEDKLPDGWKAAVPLEV